MTTSSRRITFALLLFALPLAATLHAQNPRGSLRGTVQDVTGARISSAKILAQLSGSSVQREATSEDRGEFRLDDLSAGNYRITVNAAGFAPAQADVVVAVSTVRDITVTLKPSIFCVWMRSSVLPVHAASMEANVPGVSPSTCTQ